MPRFPVLSSALVALALALAVATGCGGVNASGRTPPTPAPDSAVLERGEAAVRSGPVEDLFLVTAELRAVRSLDLVPPRSEMWQVQIKWLADDGVEAHDGDRLIEFDNTAVAQTIEEKRLNRIQKGIDLESRKASLQADGEDRRFAFERAKGEAEKAHAQADIPRDILSLREWQEKQAAAHKAEATLEKARLDLESFTVSSRAEIENLEIALAKAGREIESTQRTLDALSLHAPKNGIFVIAENYNEDRKWQIGDTTWPGQVIAEIPDLSQVEAVGYLADVDDDRIHAGMPARCVLDTYPERVFHGKIEEVATVADERRGFRVRVSLENSDASLMRPGMSARIEVVRRSWPKALTVPRRAVRFTDPGAPAASSAGSGSGSNPGPVLAARGVSGQARAAASGAGKAWVTKTGASAPVEVELAACTPTDCVVQAGLQEGDHVALR